MVTRVVKIPGMAPLMALRDSVMQATTIQDKDLGR
jgi:hypothetical protein